MEIQTMTIDVKVYFQNDDIKLPEMATDGSAGFDIAASQDAYVYHPDGVGTRMHSTKVQTGIHLEIPKGYVGLLVERSSLHTKGLTLANNIGVIDSDYRGELLIAVKSTSARTIKVEKGQKLAQLIIMPIPAVRLIGVRELNETARGIGGFGHTGT
jgi:dUTP pyrophosphatase